MSDPDTGFLKTCIQPQIIFAVGSNILLMLNKDMDKDPETVNCNPDLQFLLCKVSDHLC